MIYEIYNNKSGVVLEYVKASSKEEAWKILAKMACSDEPPSPNIVFKELSYSRFYETMFREVPETEDGFKEQKQWAFIVRQARSDAIKIEKEMAWETGAYDASEELTFEDNSKIIIHNPRQSAFRGLVYVLD